MTDKMKLSLIYERNNPLPPMDDDDAKWALDAAKKKIRKLYPDMSASMYDSDFKLVSLNFSEPELQIPIVGSEKEMKRKLDKAGFDVRSGVRYGTLIIDLANSDLR